MKKTIVIIAASLFLFSCKKENSKPVINGSYLVWQDLSGTSVLLSTNTIDTTAIYSVTATTYKDSVIVSSKQLKDSSDYSIFINTTESIKTINVSVTSKFNSFNISGF